MTILTEKTVFGGDSIGKIDGKTVFVPFTMPGETLEIEIIESKKDYDNAKYIILNEYIKLFRKMIKYKKEKYDKSYFFYDYLIKIKKLYNDMYGKDIDEMIKVLYSDKYNTKDKISWLLENCYIFDDYKL